MSIFQLVVEDMTNNLQVFLALVLEEVLEMTSLLLYLLPEKTEGINNFYFIASSEIIVYLK